LEGLAVKVYAGRVRVVFGMTKRVEAPSKPLAGGTNRGFQPAVAPEPVRSLAKGAGAVRDSGS
jgi:hypothetical protein